MYGLGGVGQWWSACVCMHKQAKGQGVQTSPLIYVRTTTKLPLGETLEKVWCGKLFHPVRQ